MPRVSRNASMAGKYSRGFQNSSGSSNLYIAAFKGDFRSVRAMIQSGADVNHREPSQDRTPIYGAILSKNVRMVQEFIQSGASVNIQNPVMDGTPLIVGIGTGKVEIVKLLLDNGADIHVRIFKSNSALHFAAELGHGSISKLLIECGLGVDIRNEYEETPLHVVVQAGKTQMVQLLIAEGADVSATCNLVMGEHGVKDLWTNITALHLAAHCNYSDIVDILIKAGADVNARTSKNCTALHLAAQRKNVELINLLLKAGAGSSVNVRLDNLLSYTPLTLAAKSGPAAVVEALLQVEGIEVNPTAADMVTPLGMAAANGHFEVAKLLVAKGAPVSGRTLSKMTPLHMALKGKKDDVAKFLIENGADIHAADNTNATPLHFACENNVSIDMIRILLEKGANVDAQKVEGETPLHLAALYDNVEIVKFLIDRGVDLNTTDKDNFTALHFAAANNSVKTVAYLVTKVSKIDVVSLSGATSLHLAVEQGHLKVAEILLKGGANVNIYDNLKLAPLHIGVINKQLEIVKLLLKHNVLLNVKAGDGCTPLYMAVEFEHKKFVSLFLDSAADVNAADNWGILPIHAAAKLQDVGIVSALLAKGAYYDVKAQAEDYSGTPLDFARKAGNAKLIVILEIIKKLFCAVIKNDTYKTELCVQAGAIVNARQASGKTALHYAVSNSNADAVKALLAADADITLATNQGDLPLQIAVERGSLKIAEMLLAHAKNLSFVKFNSVVNVKTNKDGGTVLHIAAENNECHVVELLIKNGAVYNAKNNSGKTPLELSITNEAVRSSLISAEKLFEVVKKEDSLTEITSILENDNSVVNARDADCGGTPLFWSILKGHTNIALFLLANGADYRLVTNTGLTPLHIAASEGNVKIVKALLNHATNENATKANDFINARTTSGTVALHVASSPEIVKCLLQGGGMYDIRDDEGKTALEVTHNNGIRKLLERTHQLFKNVKEGAVSVIDTLNKLGKEEFKAATGTQNSEGQTLVQVALANSHIKIASQLNKKLK